jgi:hypothetical protein
VVAVRAVGEGKKGRGEGKEKKKEIENWNNF